jgi:hypothetical protein
METPKPAQSPRLRLGNVPLCAFSRRRCRVLSGVFGYGGAAYVAVHQNQKPYHPLRRHRRSLYVLFLYSFQLIPLLPSVSPCYRRIPRLGRYHQDTNTPEGEVGGFAARIASHFNNTAWPQYITQGVLLLVGPLFFAATIYMMLGRTIVLAGGEAVSAIPARWYTRVFVGADVTTLVVQGLGTSILRKGCGWGEG